EAAGSTSTPPPSSEVATADGAAEKTAEAPKVERAATPEPAPAASKPSEKPKAPAAKKVEEPRAKPKPKPKRGATPFTPKLGAVAGYAAFTVPGGAMLSGLELQATAFAAAGYVASAFVLGVFGGSRFKPPGPPPKMGLGYPGEG